MIVWNWKWGMRQVNEKLYSAISLCRKAGKLIMGSDVVKDAVLKKRAELILVCADIAPRTRRNVDDLCAQAQARLRQLPFTMDELAPITRKKAGVLAVSDKGFAEMIENLLA